MKAGFRRCAAWFLTLTFLLSACSSQGEDRQGDGNTPVPSPPKITSTFTVQPTRPSIPTITPLPTGQGVNKPFPTATSSGETAASMLQVRVTPAAAGQKPGDDAPCYQASFLKNVTIAEGTGFQSGSPFLKVWQVQNTGSCEWTEKTALAFAHGNDFGSPPTIPLKTSVPPGAVIDLALSLKAPNRSGTFQGFWRLQNDMGVSIEMLNTPSSEMALKIIVFVPRTPEPGLTFDFTANFCMAEWANPKGPLPCPSEALIGEEGGVMRSYTPMLENNSKDNEPALLLLPADGKNGFISAIYPPYTVNKGDQFEGVIGCLQKMPKCKAVFELNYTIDGTAIQNLLTWEEVSDGRLKRIDIDLGELQGKTVQFILQVNNAGDSVDDQVFWLWPRITNPQPAD